MYIDMIVVFAGKIILANTKPGEFVFHQHSNSFGRVSINKYYIMIVTIRHIVLVKSDSEQMYTKKMD